MNARFPQQVDWSALQSESLEWRAGLRTTGRLVSLIALLLTSCGPATERSSGTGSGSLVVLISIDQLPPFLLERYDSLFTGGLRRLLDDGWKYTNAVHDHAHTWTSSGHATLATGMHPAHHGIVSNRWFEEVDGQWQLVGSVSDPNTWLTSAPDVSGASPRNLMVGGLADWIEAADPDARIVSISGKATAAIMLASRSRGHVYWFVRDLGEFATSSYYGSDYPPWVRRFNKDVLPRFLADSVWASTVPEAYRHLARRDTVEYEFDGVHTHFPHRFRDEVESGAENDLKAYYDWWRYTPSLDGATLAMAREAVATLRLGRGTGVDYLALSLSALDRVSHHYGPFSLEQLDNILRLDRALGEFLDFLDEAVGADRYVLAASSDHGVSPMPEYLRELGVPGRRINRPDERFARRVGTAAAAAAQSPAERASRVIQALERIDFIADVMTIEEISGSEAADSFLALEGRSYYPGRVPGSGMATRTLGGWWIPLSGSVEEAEARPLSLSNSLVLRLAEWAVPTSSDLTTHGTPYLYDRHVPLIFMGAAIPAGESGDPVRTVDLAPTLARLAGVSYPDGLDGRPLSPGVP